MGWGFTLPLKIGRSNAPGRLHVSRQLNSKAASFALICQLLSLSGSVGPGERYDMNCVQTLFLISEITKSESIVDGFKSAFSPLVHNKSLNPFSGQIAPFRCMG